MEASDGKIEEFFRRQIRVGLGEEDRDELARMGKTLEGCWKSRLFRVAQKGSCLRQGFGRQADAS
jgi:hypothetical protein